MSNHIYAELKRGKIVPLQPIEPLMSEEDELRILRDEALRASLALSNRLYEMQRVQSALDAR